eukprot:4664403-Alexandrium_andersonii.AAC.1
MATGTLAASAAWSDLAPLSGNRDQATGGARAARCGTAEPPTHAAAAWTGLAPSNSSAAQAGPPCSTTG